MHFSIYGVLLQIINQKGGMQSDLLNALRGCLDPTTVHQSENTLKHLSQNADFTQQLLLLIPNQQHQLLIMVLTTLKNYLLSRYNSLQDRISDQQKQILRSNLLQLYYQIKNNSNAVKLYKEILYIVIAVDYPWQGVENYLMNDLTNAIQAGVYFCRQMAKVCEYFENQQRQKLQIFISQFFPRLEQIVEQILSNFNEATSQLLPQIFKTFYSSFHITIPLYLRNFQHIEKWMLFFNTIFNIPTDNLSAKSQQIAARCYLRFFSVYCNQGLDGKAYPNWAHQFRQYFGLQLYGFIYQLVANRKGNENILSTLINCLHEVVKKQRLRVMVKDEQIRNLFYNGVLFPLCQSTQQEISMFSSDEIEYVRREDDLSCYPVRRAVQDLVEMSVNYLTFNQKPELMRMVEYSASILSSTSSSEGEKEVVVRILSKIGKLILRNKFLKSQFQNLTVQYFLPLLRYNNKIINALVCDLLSKYLPFGDLSPQTVTALMELIYEKIVNEHSLVVRYYAILAFTALLGHGSALQAAKPHFQAILQIYVKTLNAFDHQNLIESLSSIVKHFDKQIVNYAPDLLPHLLRMFCSLAKNEPEGEDDDEPDSNTPAKAALSTVKEILNCPLNQQTYYNISIDLTDLLRGILTQYNEYFDQVLSLYAVLVHKAKNIADFEYPYAICRKFLQGNNQILSRSAVQGDRLGELFKVERADSEFEESLVAILKNIIQKAPDVVLRNYPWPTHAELILALIENQRISPQQLGNLNTSEVDSIWTPYLSAYSWMVLGVGNLGNLDQVHSITGVSLYPWLKEGVNPHLVKLVTDAIDDEQDQQDLIEQNTAQLLQKYANEEQDDEEQSFFESSGKNYGFLYDSPFDSAKDRQMLIAQVRGLNQQAALQLVNSLSSKYKKKLQILMTGQNQ